jgi:capsular exopolysaccharide synthesis family protein
MPRSNVSESLRSIRTNVLFRTGNQKTRTILVTSAVPREGKSFMSSNLSAVIAMAGSRVIIIDADLRRPSVHRLFEMSDAYGLSDILMGQKSIEECIQHSHIPGLDVISAGPIPQNPSELLGSPLMRQIKEQLSGHYDVIVIDSPPATAVADPMILSPMSDGVILVVEANQTRKPVVMQAVTRLRQVQANILGGIVNKLDLRKAGYGYYYYYYSDYGYYADDEYDARKSG